MPMFFPIPRNEGALGGTLSGQTLNTAAGPADLQGVLSSLPSDLQALNTAFSQQAPQPGAVPAGPGILSTLLTSIGAGLSGQPGMAPAAIAQQQQALRQAEEANREALHNYRMSQFDLALESVKEARRRAERTDDKQEAARQQQFENQLAERAQALNEFRAQTDRMRQAGQIDAEQKEALNRELSFLLGDTLNIADQLDAILADPAQTAFNIQLPATDMRPATPISNIADLRQAYRTIKEDILGGVTDDQARRAVEQRFDNVFDMVERRLREFERRQGIAARRPEAKERASRATTTEGRGPAPRTPGGRRGAQTVARGAGGRR